MTSHPKSLRMLGNEAERRPFASSNDGKKRELPFCSRVQQCTEKSYMSFFFVSFCHIFSGPRFVKLKSSDFATMPTLRNYFFYLFLIIIKLVACALCWKYYTYLIVDGSLTNSCKFLSTLENIKFIL